MEGKLNKNEDEILKEFCEESVVIENGEIKLKGRLFFSPEKKEKNPAVLFVHGWKSKQDKIFDVARQLSTEGFISLTFNLREHGEDSGTPDKYSKKDYLEDVKAAYDFLINQEGIDNGNITVVGASMGAYLSAILTKERRVKNLLFRAPANYPDQDFDVPGMRGSDFPEIAEWRKSLHNYDETKSLRALHEFSGNVLIVESGKDDMVPHETVQSYVNAVPDKKQVEHILMPNTSHSIRTEDEKSKSEFREIVSRWMESKN